MQERIESQYHTSSGNNFIELNLQYNPFTIWDMYEYRISTQLDNKNSWHANVAHLSYPGIDQPIIEISQGDQLHSEMLVILEAICRMENSNYSADEIIEIREAVSDDVNKLKQKYDRLSDGEKKQYKEKVNNSNIVTETTNKKNDLEDLAKKEYVKQQIASCDSIKKRDEVLTYFYENAPDNTLITTERCPCRACQNTFTDVAKDIRKTLHFNYLVTLEGKSRNTVAQELEDKYTVCKMLDLARQKSNEAENKKNLIDYIKEKKSVINDLNTLWIKNPDYKNLIIIERNKAELEGLRKSKGEVEEIIRNHNNEGRQIHLNNYIARNKDSIILKLKLMLDLCNVPEFKEHIETCLNELAQLPSTSNAWQPPKNIEAQVYRIKSSMDKLKLSLDTVITNTSNNYNKLLQLTTSISNEDYQLPANSSTSSHVISLSVSTNLSTENIPSKNLDTLEKTSLKPAESSVELTTANEAKEESNAQLTQMQHKDEKLKTAKDKSSAKQEELQVENKSSKTERNRRKRERKKANKQAQKQEQFHEKQQEIIQNQQNLKAMNKEQAQSSKETDKPDDTKTNRFNF